MEKQLIEARESYQLKCYLELLAELENLHQISKMRLFYRKIRENTKRASDPQFVIHNPNATIKNPVFSSTKSDFLKYWLKYLTKVFAKKDFPAFIFPKNVQSGQSEENPLARSEVKSAIQLLKNLKASGFDEVTNEDIKLIEL